MTTTHQIAIIATKEIHNGWGDNEVIITSITDWSEVTTEELGLLVRYSRSHLHKFQVIERLDVIGSNFIPKTIEQFKKLAAKEEVERAAQAAKAKEEADARAAKRLAKQLAKQETTEKKALEELAKKHGLTLVKAHDRA